MTGNALRAGLAEFGIVAAQGHQGLRRLLRDLANDDGALPEPARVVLSFLAVQ